MNKIQTVLKENGQLVGIVLLALVVLFQAYKINNIEKLAKMNQANVAVQGQILTYFITVDPETKVNGFVKEVYNSIQILQNLGK